MEKKSKRYLLAILPLIFVALFLLFSDKPYQGTIKAATFSYSGTILADKPEGKGKITFTNGDVYTGNFKAGKMDGTGTYKTKTWSFTGNFSAGKVSGTGILTTPDGRTHKTTFVQGVLQHAD